MKCQLASLAEVRPRYGRTHQVCVALVKPPAAGPVAQMEGAFWQGTLPIDWPHTEGAASQLALESARGGVDFSPQADGLHCKGAVIPGPNRAKHGHTIA